MKNKELINDLTESFVDFSTAKRLKELGFDCFCYRTVSEINKEPSPFLILKNIAEEIVVDCLEYKWCNSKIHENIYALPTLEITIDWIKVNYNFHIQPNPLLNGKWMCSIWNLEPLSPAQCPLPSFYSKEEAKQFGITYTLKNLINV